MKQWAFCIFLLCVMSNLHAQQRYIFFLHNRFLEVSSIHDKHPEYGRCEYPEIISAFRQAHFTVISEIRTKDTDAKAYAHKVAKQVDSLLKTGVKPGNITVIGTSKGGYIAMYVSSLLTDKQVNYVFIGCCEEDVEQVPADIRFHGNILSIYEKSDALGRSCVNLKTRSGNDVAKFKEIGLNTGLKHGFLFKAMDEWIAPCISWAKGL